MLRAVDGAAGRPEHIRDLARRFVRESAAASAPAVDIRKMEVALQEAKATAEFVVSPGAPHAFFADDRPSYRAEPATDAWQRALAWFGRHPRG